MNIRTLTKGKGMRRFIGAALAALCITTGVAACGSSGPVAYTPAAAAWGNAGLGQCYMPLGVPQSAWQAIEQQYIAAHYCQAGWTPLYMPQSTYMQYYPYWSNSIYYNHYLPVTYRTTYVHYETGFGRQYHSQILTAERNAPYKGSNGKTTTFNKIKSGGGSRTQFGTGVKSSHCDRVPSFLLARGGGGFSGGGSRGGGGSGGGARSGGGSRTGSGSGKSGTTTKSGSGSHSGC